jgi:hypothetical protein
MSLSDAYDVEVIGLKVTMRCRHCRTCWVVFKDAGEGMWRCPNGPHDAGQTALRIHVIPVIPHSGVHASLKAPTRQLHLLPTAAGVARSMNHTIQERSPPGREGHWRAVRKGSRSTPLGGGAPLGSN